MTKKLAEDLETLMRKFVALEKERDEYKIGRNEAQRELKELYESTNPYMENELSAEIFGLEMIQRRLVTMLEQIRIAYLGEEETDKKIIENALNDFVNFQRWHIWYRDEMFKRKQNRIRE